MSSHPGPAPELITNSIFEISKTLTEYKIMDLPEIDISVLGNTVFGKFTITVFDAVEDYVIMMKEIFDFDFIRSFLRSSPQFTVLFDAMHAVTGPYATRILCKELGLPPNSVMNAIPSENFGGGHPDPNLTYAHELVDIVERDSISFGAASDGDGDRNMIIGKGCFVNPSDSVAVIAANAMCIPYFKKHGVKGLARSMPTSGALDRVAEKQGIKFFQVPTG